MMIENSTSTCRIVASIILGMIDQTVSLNRRIDRFGETWLAGTVCRVLLVREDCPEWAVSIDNVILALRREDIRLH